MSAAPVQAAAPDLAPGTDIETARRALADLFRRAGIDSPDLDARILIGHALGLDRTALAVHAARALPAAQIDAIAAIARRRLAREPVARIVGSREFWGLPFALSAQTLIPRPETETLVEAALAAIGPMRARGQKLRIADFGTGTGAILLALLHECPDAFGVGTDLSVPALATARANAIALALDTRAAFVACDYGAALAGSFDCIVSNPPYIPACDIAALAPDVRDFDPRLALDGGIDGLDGYRSVAAHAQRLLRPGGVLLVELGAGQEGAVCAIMTAQGLPPAGPARKDLAGIPRALTLCPSP
jgi:release factor glutamine methyltransferase